MKDQVRGLLCSLFPSRRDIFNSAQLNFIAPIRLHWTKPSLICSEKIAAFACRSTTILAKLSSVVRSAMMASGVKYNVAALRVNPALQPTPSGMGELHLEIVRSRLLDEYKVELLTSMFSYFGFSQPPAPIKSFILLLISISHVSGPLKVAYRERAGHDVKHFAHSIKREMSSIMFVSCPLLPTSRWPPLWALLTACL